MPKARRHQLLTDLLRKGPIASQVDLAEVLANAGEAATQATISRDLKSLGALKGPAGYTLPTNNFHAAPKPITNGRDHVYSAYIHKISQAGNLVVLHTAPGHAQVVATAIDDSPPLDAIGTVAGDDTIFIATPGIDTARRLTAHMLEAAGLQGVGV